MSLLNAILQATNFKTPLLRTVIPCIGLAYSMQAAAAIPSIVFQTERFYDLSGSLTYISCTALSLSLPRLRARAASAPPPPWNWRQVVLAAAVTAWASRLGAFLFARIGRDGGRDSRFDGIRGRAVALGLAFAAQATWVALCLLPVLAVNAIPARALAALPPVMATDALGLAMYAGGLAFEVVADAQRSRWVQERKEKKHSEEFLTRGLWSKSRHPNYFGETTLWTGIATVAAGVMMSNAGQAGMGFAGGLVGKIGALAMAAVSPAFAAFLLLKVSRLERLVAKLTDTDSKVSGVPLSEKKYDKRFKGNKEYEKWKRDTPMFIPKL